MNHRHAVFHRDGLPSALLQVDIASGEARQDQYLLTVRGRALSWLQTGTTTDLLFGKHATVAGSMFRCWATNARGMWDSQPESDTPKN
jgi:hypothetical protein